MQVRELPPLRLHILATSPTGKTWRWGEDERRAENNFKGLSFSTVMPGGHETCECTLPRKTRVSYQDMTRLSTLTVKGPGGRIASETRLEKTPRASGDDRNIQPQAVGWQAHLDDDSQAAEVYRDSALDHWGEPSSSRRLALHTGGTPYAVIEGPTVEPDASTGIPGLLLRFSTEKNQSAAAEALYDAGSARISSIYYDMTSHADSASFTGYVGVASTDAFAAQENTADLIAGVDDTDAATFSPTARYRYGWASFAVPALADHGESDDHWMTLRRLAVYGNHGLTKRGTEPAAGFYASDVVANAISRWCPLYRFTTGSDGTIRPSSFVIPQIEFRAFTTAGNILKEAAKYELPDWAVWEGDRPGEPKFYYNERNGRGKRWRARVAPAKLTETGPQVDRLFNGVIVSYQDVDGSTRTVGPPGTLADVTDDSLLDTDPLNPANQLGIKRYVILDMGMVSTSAGAIKVGSVFLEQAKAFDQSGSAELTGHVTDDHGVVHPAWAVRAGDQISFTDASDTSYRRIVKTSYSHDSRTNSIDLDSPPEGMDALLASLSVAVGPGAPTIQQPFSRTYPYNIFGL